MVYLFIAPIIYIFLGVVVIGLILLSVWIKKVSKNIGLNNTIQLTAWVFVILDIIYLLIYYFMDNQFSYMLNPIIPVIISIIIIFSLSKYIEKRKKFELSAFLFSIGIWFLLIAITVLAQWQSIPSWTQAYNDANPGKGVEMQPFAFILVCGLTLLGTFIIFIFAKLLSPRYSKLLPFTAGINLILFSGHFLDASATFVAVDYYGYVEKHVLPGFLIELFHTAAIMYILKALIIILVVYFIDVLYRKDFQANPILSGLVKIAILVLGLGPGLRDILRLGIGV